MNALTELNMLRMQGIKKSVAVKKKLYLEKPASISLDHYYLIELEDLISRIVGDKLKIPDIVVVLEVLERGKFQADISVKFPKVLKSVGPKAFASNISPKIVEALLQHEFSHAFSSVRAVGIYVNVGLKNDWLLWCAHESCSMGPNFGKNSFLSSRTFVVDYSSPNVAKKLHAGHIRSTILGHVLSNIYEYCGALVYRINHVNDFGGFGYIMEGYLRFQDMLSLEPTVADKLNKVYSVWRTLERTVDQDLEGDKIPEVDRSVIQQFFRCDLTSNELKRCYTDFAESAAKHAYGLEEGRAQDVSLWQNLVDHSLSDFNDFYKSLNIKFDLIIGESFYVEAGKSIVMDGLKTGSAVRFSVDVANTEESLLEKAQRSDEISTIEAISISEGIQRDIGAVVTRVGNFRRFVLLRSDGQSIYATRDIGAISLRREIFDPSDIEYIVGKEQQDYFRDLFAAARILGIVDQKRPRLVHRYFGFYVDSKTKKKLSSRASAVSVSDLLTQSNLYFRSKLSNRVQENDLQIEEAAKQLAIGSLVFNDLKQDVQGNVEIQSDSHLATIESFEKAGGAYVVYATCRARSILRKYGKSTPGVEHLAGKQITESEVKLLIAVQLFPKVLAKTSSNGDPSILLRFLLKLAEDYNSYYTESPVLTTSGPELHRVVVTEAVYHTLRNGLSICHIDCPESI